MPPRDWKFRVRDILEAIEKIESYVAEKDESSFLTDGLTADAVVRNLEIIAEAASRLPEEVRAAHPEIDWHRMRGMRNLIVHEYYRVDLEIAWTTIQEDLPPVRDQLTQLLADEESM